MEALQEPVVSLPTPMILSILYSGLDLLLNENFLV